MEQTIIKDIAKKWTPTLIKVEGAPEELKEKVETLVMGFVFGYETKEAESEVN